MIDLSTITAGESNIQGEEKNAFMRYPFMGASTSIHDEFYKNGYDQIVKQEEDLIKGAITHAMGSCNWTIDSVKDRCKLVECVATRGKKFYFDDVLLVEFYQVEVNELHDHNTREYKIEFKLPCKKHY